MQKNNIFKIAKNENKGRNLFHRSVENCSVFFRPSDYQDEFFSESFKNIFKGFPCFCDFCDYIVDSNDFDHFCQTFKSRSLP